MRKGSVGSEAIEIDIHIQKVVWDEAAAEAESDRLNSMNRDKGAQYSVRLARVMRRAQD